MSHVDEGTLHAYLDGEVSSGERAAVENHLATCATCRERLSEERALLQRASSLLGAARPAERPLPPFEHVRRTPKRAPWHVSTRIAWAASIVLAVGLGYYLRGGGAKREVPSAIDFRAESATTVAAAPADKAAESARPSRRPREQERSADLVERRDAAAVATGARLDSPAGLISQQPAIQLRGASPAARQREADSLVVIDGVRSARALEEVVVTAPAAPAAAPAAQPSGENMKVSGAPGRVESRSVRNLVSTTWPLISQGAATSMLGERPVGIPGLATRRIRRSPAGDTVVVEQALDSSTVIQIYQRPAGGAADSGQMGYVGGVERQRADRILARYVGRLRVEISGPVSTDSLNRLLEQVEPLP